MSSSSPLTIVALVLAALGPSSLCGCGASKDESAAQAGPPAAPPAASPAVPHDSFPGERHLKSIRQLTFAGENAEAYWSNAGDRLIFQTTRPPYTADQIFVMGTDGSDPHLVSTGKGRTTCGWFLPGDKRILYSSTHWLSDEPPTPPDRSHGYVWGIFQYRMFTANLDGSDLRPLTAAPGYNAEATVSRQGDRIVFTSSRDGDLDVYTMALDGSGVKRLTTDVGYDGGAVWSPDGTKIAYRGEHPQTDDGKAEFKALLAKGLVRPVHLEILLMDRDGSNKHEVTHNGKANFGPWFHPDGQRIIFASNMDDPSGRSFDLYLVRLDGTGLDRVTAYTNEKHDDFDGFPMFSPDGKRLAWCSNRHNAHPHETNVFVADWVE